MLLLQWVVYSSKREQKYAGGTTRDKEKLRGVILYSQRISDEPRALGSL